MVESIKELREICQKRDKRYDNAVEKFTRNFSIYFTKVLLYTNISANQVTLLNIIIGIFACFFMAIGHEFFFILGTLFLLLWFIFDRVDGEIAHYRKTEGVTGEYVDRLNHIIIDPLIFISMAIGLNNIFNDILIFIFGFSAAVSICILKLIVYSMHLCVVEDYLHSGKNQINYETIESEEVGLEELKSNLNVHISILYKIANFTMLPPGLIIMILLASMIDLIISPIKIGSFILNVKYLLLGIYSILMPIVFIFMALLIIRNKSPEKLYNKLFKRE